MLEGVADQVGSDLRKPVCIPAAAQVTLLVQREAAARKCDLVLLDDPLYQLAEIALLAA